MARSVLSKQIRLGASGPILKNNAGTLEARTSTDGALGVFRCGTAVGATDAVPKAQAALVADLGAASGVATLNSGSKVVQDPANATATPTASKIPINHATRGLDSWLYVYTSHASAPNNSICVASDGKVGIGTTSPSVALGFVGTSAATIRVERETTADTAGKAMTIKGGGATLAATNKAGGDVVVTPGTSTGTGESGVQVQGCPAGGSGTSDGTPTTLIQVLGNKLGFHGVTPIIRATLATGGGATVDNVITALQNLGLVKQS